MGIQNIIADLDLLLTETCDSSAVVGYVLTTDNVSVEQTNPKIDTSKYSCGDKVRIKANAGAIIVLI